MTVARLWVARGSLVILALLAIAMIVGMVVVYLDLVQLGHDLNLPGDGAQPHSFD
jgi:hypothetical protein